MESFNERLKHLRLSQNLSQKDLARILSVGQTTIANYENGDRFPSPMTLYRLADYFDVSTDFLYGRVEKQGKKIEKMTEEDYLENQRQFYEHLLNGDRFNASLVVTRLMESSTDPWMVYKYLFVRTLNQLGCYWDQGKIDIHEEHRISNLIEMILSQVYPYIASSKKRDAIILTLSPNGEQHGITSRIMSDYFEMAGYRTYHLGIGLPCGEVIKAIQSSGAAVVAISVTLKEHLESAGYLINAIRIQTDLEDVKIIVGGQAFTSEEDWQSIGADAYGEDFEKCLEEVDRLLLNG